MALHSNEFPARYNVVMFSFDGVDTAARALEKIKHRKALKELEVEGDALISRGPTGEIRFHEHGGTAIGAALGATAGGILGVMAGPLVVLVMLLGGLLGGAVGHFAGKMLPADDLERVAQDLPPNSSAYLAVVDTDHADALASAFAAEGARVLNMPIETGLASAIREGINRSVTRVG